MTLTHSYTHARTNIKSVEESVAQSSEAKSAEYDGGGYEGEVGDNDEIMSQRKATEGCYVEDLQDREYGGEILDHREDVEVNL